MLVLENAERHPGFIMMERFISLIPLVLLGAILAIFAKVTFQAGGNDQWVAGLPGMVVFLVYARVGKGKKKAT
ncbi:MAG: hypothetical protein VX916_02550 [Planctomycetota bacterium]|nr:hypothetical protein [Planctomycetota bacterium]